MLNERSLPTISTKFRLLYVYVCIYIILLNFTGPGVPSLKVRPLDVMVAEGSDAILDCAFDGAAMVEWYAHGHDTPLQNGSRMTIWPNNSLSIRTVAKKDEGMFQCVAIPRHRGVPQQVFAARLSVACKCLSFKTF